ncbi:MAG TPA: IS110 family transposase [Myxococcota bacterium]|nr:IS110 family transposase [Myxococcota bacterium]
MLFVALELSRTTWVLAASDRNGVVEKRAMVSAHDYPALERLFVALKKKLGLSPDAVVRTCYEAGRDGFSVHRALVDMGHENVVLDPASIEVSRRAHAKTDRLDASRLLRLLLRLAGGERAAHVVEVPTEEQEDARHLHREREKLLNSRTSETNRIAGLLATQGIECNGRTLVLDEVDEMSLSSGAPIPPGLRARVARAIEARDLFCRQLRNVEREIKAELKTLEASKDVVDDNPVMLQKLRAIGIHGAFVLAREMFFRKFKNRRQVGAYTGLVPVPKLSGAGGHVGSISKAGNRRVRRVLVEQAWLWLRHQPNSALSRWFEQRWGTGKRSRRIGIVALARKLAIALWRYLDAGLVPDGATLKANA